MGAAPNDGTGAQLREAFMQVNARFAAVQPLVASQFLNTGGTLAVDLSKGRYVRASLPADVPVLLFTNWLPAPLLDEVWLDVTSFGHTIDLSGIRWAGTAVPALTRSGRDIFRLLTTDGGITVFGQVFGQGFVR